MVTYVIGRSGTGKSAFYERRIEAYQNRLYMATILNRPENAITIHRHQERRDQNWILLTTSGYLEKDLCVLKNTLRLMEMPFACMIDGIVNWCISCCTISSHLPIIAHVLCISLATIILEHDDAEWYILDNEKDDYTCDSLLQETWDTIDYTLHRQLVGMVEKKWRAIK